MMFAQLRGNKLDAKNLWQNMIDPAIWWHPSAKLDYQLWIANPAIRLGIMAFVGISLTPIALATDSFLKTQFGDISVSWSKLQLTAAYTLALFIADDLSRFLLHFLMHKVPCLWSLHRLHHSAEVMTPFTVYRIHPIESFLYSLRSILTQGLVLGLFFFCFGLHLSVWEIAGANLFTYLFNLAGANLRHSHVWLSWGPYLERVFISPAQHQIHHSVDPKHFNKNMGACLAIWDALFSTLLIARHQTVTAFGLQRKHRSPHQNLLKAYSEPCIHFISNFKHNNIMQLQIVIICIIFSVQILN